MLIGTMNHPGMDVIEEIRWMAAMGLEFLDLTLEPPRAASWQVDSRAIRDALADHGMEAVGHTAYYLPLGSSVDALRRAAVEELQRCVQVFAAVGVKWMNIHPDRFAPFHDRAYSIARNLESLSELLPAARDHGVGLMLENLPGEFNTARQLSDLLDPIPELGLHLDFGHANLRAPANTAEDILKRYGHRLKHVHLHDNRGGQDDLHLPLGVGVIDVGGVVRALKSCGYDGTITLEVFTPDKHFLAHSRDMLRRIWDSTQAPRLTQPRALSSA